MEQATIICNRTSGRYRYSVMTRILNALRPHYELDVRYPADTKHTQQMAGEARGKLLIIAGGDGTISTVLETVIKQEKFPNIGILPFGTANVLAHELGIGNSMDNAVKAIISGKTWKSHIGIIDTGEKEKAFTCMAGAGFDSQAVAEVSRILKTYTGKFAYVLSAMISFIGRPQKIKAKINGEEYTGTQVTVMKGRRYGGSFTVLPANMGGIDKPFFQVIVNDTVNPLRLFWELRKIRKGKLDSLKCSKVIKCDRLKLMTEDLGFPVQGDGDTAGFLPASIRLHEKMVDFITL